MKKLTFLIVLLLTLSVSAFAKTKTDEDFIKSVFLYWENDVLYMTDQYYTDGIQLIFTTSKTDRLPDKYLSKLFSIDDIDFHNYSFGIGQNIYTQSTIRRSDKIPHDRPYAGYLYLFLNENIRHDNKIDVVGLTLGATGKIALGQDVQNGIHKIIVNQPAKGWDNQLSNELLLMASFMRVFELHKTTPYSFDWNFLPKVYANLGTPFTRANAAMELRWGWNLDDDFNAHKIQPISSNIEHTFVKNANHSDISFYLFFEAAENLSLYNTFLDGNLFGSKLDIEKNLFYHELVGGLMFRIRHFYIKYSHFYTSKEFKEQEADHTVFTATFGYLF